MISSPCSCSADTLPSRWVWWSWAASASGSFDLCFGCVACLGTRASGFASAAAGFGWCRRLSRDPDMITQWTPWWCSRIDLFFLLLLRWFWGHFGGPQCPFQRLRIWKTQMGLRRSWPRFLRSAAHLLMLLFPDHLPSHLSSSHIIRPDPFPPRFLLAGSVLQLAVQVKQYLLKKPIASQPLTSPKVLYLPRSRQPPRPLELTQGFLRMHLQQFAARQVPVHPHQPHVPLQICSSPISITFWKRRTLREYALVCSRQRLRALSFWIGAWRTWREKRHGAAPAGYPHFYQT